MRAKPDCEGTIVTQVSMELILKIMAPDTGATRTVATRISSLNHKPANDTMENHIVVVSITAVHSEVLHSLGTSENTHNVIR